jgi:hypothetical protein
MARKKRIPVSTVLDVDGDHAGYLSTTVPSKVRDYDHTCLLSSENSLIKFPLVGIYLHVAVGLYNLEYLLSYYTNCEDINDMICKELARFCIMYFLSLLHGCCSLSLPLTS